MCKEVSGKKKFSTQRNSKQNLNTFESPYNVIEVARKHYAKKIHVIWKSSLEASLFGEPVFNVIQSFDYTTKFQFF
jgi:hypothetical protein